MTPFFDRLTTNDHKLYKLDKLQEVGWEYSLCDSKGLPVLHVYMTFEQTEFNIDCFTITVSRSNYKSSKDQAWYKAPDI